MNLVLSDVDEHMTVHLSPVRRMTDDEFWDFCQANPNLRMERTAEGEIVVIPPAGFEWGGRNLSIGSQLYVWCVVDGRGRAFDSSTGYILPIGAMVFPDASWVANKKISSPAAGEKEKFPHFCPDFVIALMSQSDRQPPVDGFVLQLDDIWAGL